MNVDPVLGRIVQHVPHHGGQLLPDAGGGDSGCERRVRKLRRGGLKLTRLLLSEQTCSYDTWSKGASSDDIRKIFGYFDPLPLVCIWS